MKLNEMEFTAFTLRQHEGTMLDQQEQALEAHRTAHTKSFQEIRRLVEEHHGLPEYAIGTTHRVNVGTREVEPIPEGEQAHGGLDRTSRVGWNRQPGEPEERAVTSTVPSELLHDPAIHGPRPKKGRKGK